MELGAKMQVEPKEIKRSEARPKPERTPELTQMLSAAMANGVVNFTIWNHSAFQKQFFFVDEHNPASPAHP